MSSNCPQRDRMAGFAIKALDNQIKRHLQQNGQLSEERRLSGIQVGILNYLGSRQDSEIYQKDIEARFNIRRSTATGILQNMEKCGLVRREAVAHDARLKRLVLTEEALAIREVVAQDMKQLEATITKGITPGELDTFYAVVEKMLRNLKD